MTTPGKYKVYKVARRCLDNGRYHSSLWEVQEPLCLFYSIGQLTLGHGRSPVFVYTRLQDALGALTGHTDSTYRIFVCDALTKPVHYPFQYNPPYCLTTADPKQLDRFHVAVNQAIKAQKYNTIRPDLFYTFLTRGVIPHTLLPYRWSSKDCMVVDEAGEWVFREDYVRLNGLT